MEHIEVRLITQKQRNNLKQLADYLIKLPDDYNHFDMNFYFAVRPYDNIGFQEVKNPLSSSLKGYLHKCGTVACAIGHGPDAGILPELKEYYSSWEIYEEEMFGAGNIVYEESLLLHDWLFSHHWRNKDNTPHGAAKRIYYFLEHGVPSDHYYQMNKEDYPLCY